MENAVDALKMAGSVLLFVLALSIAVPAFTNARIAIDAILDKSDRESLTIENDDRFYYVSSGDVLNNNQLNRRVGLETIIPAMYRAYKENYRIVFVFKDSSYYLYKKDGEEMRTIDLYNQSIASDEQSKVFLNGIIYGFGSNRELDRTTWETQFGVKSYSGSPLYDYISSYTRPIKEELGTYYMEEVQGGSAGSGITENNYVEKRVITYTFE